MKLSAYKRKTGVSYTHIARVCGVTPAMISQIATGSNTPSFELAIKIEKATSGQVGRENWYRPRPPDISVTIGATSL